MRINHNIAAMNTYGKLTANNSATAKSLEKLSSGLKINRAGDNAAGLAISEKMRAQIRGLDQASTNASDAISLIQTAEGSLSETHSILQRMKELATQSANDTNTTSDRAEIQKEINQLSSEINRIGNTTEFNTRLLLNGGTEVDNKATASAKTLVGGLSVGDVNGTATVPVGTAGTGLSDVAAHLTSGAITLATADGASTLAIGNTTLTINWDNGVTGAYTAADITGVNGGAGTASLALDRGSTQANAATAIAAALNAIVSNADYTGDLKGATFSANGTAVEASISTNTAAANANALAFTATAGGGTAFIVAQTGNDVATQVGASVAGSVSGVDGIRANGNIRFNTGTGVPAEGTSITLANQTIAFYDSTSGNFADADAAKTALSADKVVDINGLTSGTETAARIVAAVNAAPITGYTVAVDGTNSDQVNVTATSEGPSGLLSTQIANIHNVNTASAATGSVTFSGVPSEDSKVTIGSKSFGFYDSSSGKYADAAAAKTALGTDFVIDAKNLTTADSVKNAVMAYGPQITDVVMSDGGVGKITVTAATAGAAGNQIKLTVPEKTTSGFDAKFQIGANSNQSMQIDMSDMRSQALDITSNTGSASVTADNGKVAYYTATSNVTNGTDNTNTEFALDVSTHDKATAAISVLSDAIQTVSAERSKMGAYQNRLEHTINNLGTSSENLSAAESRIRDVDMAKEMMEFQKNNILSQAATSMLAQANQQPQGVLQLLQ